VRASLPEEVRAYLLGHGPHTATDIAYGVCARRSDVDVVLAAGGFRRVPVPEGENPRARYFDLSPAVPVPLRRGSRAAQMLRVLRDGKRHSREEILQLAGGFFLTNNAASELRRMGYDVQHAYEKGLHVYWLVPPAEAAAA
jgi:hypothetical protein